MRDRVAGRGATRGIRQREAPTTYDDLRQRHWLTGPALRRKLGNVSPMTLWRWRRNKDFPVPKVINNRLYFAEDQVEAWITARPDGIPSK
jgi:predicted DNA-binding transcriptional regulator AlpA